MAIKYLATIILMLCLVAPTSHALDFSNLMWLAQASDEGQAAAMAQKQYGGKVLNVKSENQNGHTVYKVKLLQKSGRVKIVTISGRKG